MEIIFGPKALKDRQYWQDTNNTKIQDRITELLESIIETPFSGIGKPEALKHHLRGCWSRRIDREHRLVYEVEDEIVHILSLRGHY